MSVKSNVTTSQGIHQAVLYNVNLSSYKGYCNIHSRKNIVWEQQEQKNHMGAG